MKVRNRALAALPALLLAAASAGAAPHPELEAEQVNLHPAAAWTAVGGPAGQQLAQSFTVGRKAYLSHAMLPMSCQPRADVRVTIEKTDPAGRPNGSVIAYEELSGHLFTSMSTPAVGMRMIEFGNPPLVVPGTYALVVRVKGKHSCAVVASPPGDWYSGGKGWFIALPNPPEWIELFSGEGTHELAFQVYVRPL